MMKLSGKSHGYSSYLGNVTANDVNNGSETVSHMSAGSETVNDRLSQVKQLIICYRKLNSQWLAVASKTGKVMPIVV